MGATCTIQSPARSPEEPRSWSSKGPPLPVAVAPVVSKVVRYQATAFNAPEVPAMPPRNYENLAAALHGLAGIASAWDTVLLWRFEADGARTLVLRYDVDGHDL